MNYEYTDDGKCAMWKYAHERRISERIAVNVLPNLAIQGEFCDAEHPEEPAEAN